MTLWLIVIGMGLATFATRASFIFLPLHTHIPARLRHALKYVAAAILPALIVPDVLYHGSTPFDVTRLAAALFAALVAWRTHNMLATIAAGIAVLVALNYLTGM